MTAFFAAKAPFSSAIGLIGALLLSACGSPATTKPSAGDPRVQAAIDAAVTKERNLYGGVTPVPAVLVGVWDGSGKSYVRAFGDADLATHRALTPEDHFRIGSNTKTFVISVLLQLVDEGKLSLDDPLSKFPLGVSVPNAEHITVRQMCQMRSGLFEAFDSPEFDRLQLKPDMTFDPRTMIGWAVKQPPYFAPGAGYRYSNTNYLLLGLIIEKVTGNSIATEIQQPPPGTVLAYPHQLSGQSGDARSLGSRLWIGRQARLGRCQRHDPGVLDGRGGRNDLRYARHEAMG